MLLDLLVKPVQLDQQVQLERHQQFQVLPDQLDLPVQLVLQVHKEMHRQFLDQQDQQVQQDLAELKV